MLGLLVGFAVGCGLTEDDPDTTDDELNCHYGYGCYGYYGHR